MQQNKEEEKVIIKTQPNEKRCSITIVSHVIDLPMCCPVSKNPHAGSKVVISYQPDKYILEVASLKKYIESYQGGKGEIRSMEGMIQSITKDCAVTVGVTVTIESDLIIKPEQLLKLKTTHHV